MKLNCYFKILFSFSQITFSGEPSEQPKWEQMFFFHADGSSLFSSFSALVIEYFNTSQGKMRYFVRLRPDPFMYSRTVDG